LANGLIQSCYGDAFAGSQAAPQEGNPNTGSPGATRLPYSGRRLWMAYDTRPVARLASPLSVLGLHIVEP
jgi:hypothetical protein